MRADAQARSLALLEAKRTAAEREARRLRIVAQQHQLSARGTLALLCCHGLLATRLFLPSLVLFF